MAKNLPKQLSTQRLETWAKDNALKKRTARSDKRTGNFDGRRRNARFADKEHESKRETPHKNRIA